MPTRRKILRDAAVASALAALVQPVRAQSQIRWRMQTYASATLAREVVIPAVNNFNAIAGESMQIELSFADELAPTDELFRALQQGTIDAVQSDDDSMSSPTEVSVFGGYFPFACRYASDIPVLFNQYGLQDIWEEEYAKVGVQHISAGAWDPCHIATVTPINSVADLEGKRIFTFPTAGRFLAQFGVIATNVAWDDIEQAVRDEALDGVAWSGITELYTLGWVDFLNYFLTNSISGAWCGSFFANLERWQELPPSLQTLLRVCFDQSHYRRQWWYWGGEAVLRSSGNKLELTHIPASEWRQVESTARAFWEQIASEGPTKLRVVEILKRFNRDMELAGAPYRQV